MTKEQIRQARIERNPQPWEIDDFILAMCERQRAEDSKDIANLQHIAKSEKDSEKEISQLKEQIENQRGAIRRLKDIIEKEPPVVIAKVEDIKAVQQVAKVDPNVIKRPRAAKKSSRKK